MLIVSRLWKHMRNSKATNLINLSVTSNTLWVSLTVAGFESLTANRQVCVGVLRVSSGIGKTIFWCHVRFLQRYWQLTLLSSYQLSLGISWRNEQKAVVVDVGGSRGDISIMLARSFPNLRCVVQDLPPSAGSTLNILDSGADDRLPTSRRPFRAR